MKTEMQKTAKYKKSEKLKTYRVKVKPKLKSLREVKPKQFY